MDHLFGGVSILASNLEETLLEHSNIGTGQFLFDKPTRVGDRGHECFRMRRCDRNNAIEPSEDKLLSVNPLLNDLSSLHAAQLHRERLSGIHCTEREEL